MVSQESILRKLKRIEAEEDLGLAIELLAEVVAEAETYGFQARKKLEEQVSIMREILVGNGKPSASLVSRMDQIEREVRESCAAMANVERALMGDLSGDSSKKSLMGRVTEVEERAIDIEDDVDSLTTTLKKLAWLIGSVIVTEIVLRIVGLL